jgi:hypothetical protein
MLAGSLWMMRVVPEVEELGKPIATIYLRGMGYSMRGRRGHVEVGTVYVARACSCRMLEVCVTAS